MEHNKKKKKGLKKLKPKALDDATFNYYLRITTLYNKDEFENEEDKERFENSVLKQLSKEGLKVSKEGMISKLMEKLIARANIKQFHGILMNFSSDWEIACCDRFSSFVTQSLIRYSSKYFVDITTLMKDNKESFKEEELRTFQEEILKTILDGLIAFLYSKFALFMQHFSTSHVIRVVIEMLAGMKVDDGIVCGKKNYEQQDKLSSHSVVSIIRPEIRSMFEKLFIRICDAIISLPKMEDHVCNYLSNPVLQTLVLCLKSLSYNISQNIFTILINNTKIFDNNGVDSIPTLCCHEVASHFAEQLFKSLPDDMFDKIYSENFKGHLAKMSSLPVANFVLQKLISCSRTKDQFELMYNEIHPHFESILAINHVDVIVKIAETCIKHSCKQVKFVKHISKAFHCYEPDSRRCKIAQLLLSLTTYEMFYKIPDENEESKLKMVENNDDESDDDKLNEDNGSLCLPQMHSINIYGSIIMQNILNFSNTSSIVSSLFELSIEEWKLLCKDPCGCRVVETFVNSNKISEKSKESFYTKLAGIYLDIACDKWGSRSFDALWMNAKQKGKMLIVDELNKNPNKLKSDRFGSFIFQKCLNSSLKRKNYGNERTQYKKLKI